MAANETSKAVVVSVDELRRLRLKAVKLVYENGSASDIRNIAASAEVIVKYVTNGVEEHTEHGG